MVFDILVASNHYDAPDLDLDPDLDQDQDPDQDLNIDLDPDQDQNQDLDLDPVHFCLLPLIIVLLQT